MKEQSISFDKMANKYKEMVEDGLKGTGFDINYITEYKIKDLKKEISFYLKDKENLNILDYGCGIGLSTPFLEKEFPNSTFCACDISEKSVEKAIETNKNLKTKYAVCNGKELPFSEKFDVIFLGNVVRHIPRENQKETLKILKNSLTENGIIFMYEFNPFNPVTLFFYLIEDYRYDPNVKIMTPFYTKNLFKAIGFKSVKTRYSYFIPNNFKKILFLEKYLRSIPIGANYYCVTQNDR